MKRMKKILCLVLVLGMALTVGPGLGFATSGSDEGTVHLSLSEAIDLFNIHLDEDNMLLRTAETYKGWRTNFGNWLNQVDEGIRLDLIEAGFRDGERTTAGNEGDSVWYKVEATSNRVAWNLQYASLSVVAPPMDAMSGAEMQELVDAVGFVADCIDPTSMYYPADVTAQYMVDSLKYEEDPVLYADYAEAFARQQGVNKRVHVPTNMAFTKLTDEGKSPAQNITEGTVRAEVVDVGTVTANSNSKGYTPAELAGKILLTTSSGSTARTYATSVGAFAVLARVSDAPNYHMPVIDGERWYTSYVPFTGMGNYAAPGVGAIGLHFSLDQYNALTPLLAAAEEEGAAVEMDICILGTYETGKSMKILVAEIEGATKPEERIYIPAHVNEPGACDNATGVGMSFEIAYRLKKMIDAGLVERPERTITFVWGDEIQMTNRWMEFYGSELASVKGSIDLDMTGEDPLKTGGNMLIDKTPDPSNVARTPVPADMRYRYGNFTYPGQANLPLTYPLSDGYIRKPDRNSLWTGVTSTNSQPTTPGNNYPGLYLNDMYLQTALSVSDVDAAINPGLPLFEVDYNVYEGGSDHVPFVTGAIGSAGAPIPALLSWHFTDYVYHSSCDTLDKASKRELKNVGLTSIAVIYQMANADEPEVFEIIDQIMASWEVRLKDEMKNTADHYDWVMDNNITGDAFTTKYNTELKAIADWNRWYIEAVRSAARFFISGKLGTPYKYRMSAELTNGEAAAVAKIQEETLVALAYVDSVFGKYSSDRPKQIATAYLPEPILVKTGTYASLADLTASELPSKVTVEYSGGGVGEVDVVWTTAYPNFNASREGLYRVVGTLSGFEDGVINWAALQAVAEVNSFDYDSIDAVPAASVEKLTGNMNNLTISITQNYMKGNKAVYTDYFDETFAINNNAAAVYNVGDYIVYVDTKGNTQIRECYIVGDPNTSVGPPPEQAEPVAVPSAVLEKLNGNTNNVLISVKVTQADGKTATFTEKFSVKNNESGTFKVGGYNVFVNTQGNSIKECKLVD